MDNIGQKIKKIRELRNISRQFVARELNVSMTTYGNIERDETDVTIRRLAHIAKILNVEIATILEFDENKLFRKGNWK